LLKKSKALTACSALGPPEETVVTRIERNGTVRLFRRLIFPTEIILIEESAQGNLSNHEVGLSPAKNNLWQCARAMIPG